MATASDSQRSFEGIEERQALDPASPWWVMHVARYLFAATQVEQCCLLDIACGTGYGMNIVLRRGARVVIGVDIDREAARDARSALSSDAGHVVLADGCHLPFADRSFDIITSFETLEHLVHREQFLSELKRVVKPKGRLILSTPNANYTKPLNGKPRNPYHIFEYNPQELHAELSRHFTNIIMLGQVLDPRFKIPPFWDEQERLSREPRMRPQILLWRALNKLPAILSDSVSNRLWGQPLLPGETDYSFSESAVETAPVLVALCQNDLSY